MCICTYTTSAPSEDVKEIGKKEELFFCKPAWVGSNGAVRQWRRAFRLLCKPADTSSALLEAVDAASCQSAAAPPRLPCAWRFYSLLQACLLCRAKNLQGSAKSWRGSDSANDRSPLSRQKDFLHVYVTNTTKMKHCTR